MPSWKKILQSGSAVHVPNITASSLPNVSQPNVVGYDISTGRLTYMPTSSISSSSPTLIQTLTANVTVGGVSSGTSFNSGSQLEQVLRSILITFIPATISSLTVRNGVSTVSLSNRDVNDSFTINTASFTATADNPNNRLPQSASFTSSNADSDFQHYLSDTLTTSNAFGLGSSRTINKASTNGTITFTVRALRPDNGSIISTTTNVSFLFRNYLAASSTIVSNNITAQTVINAYVDSTLATSKSWTATCAAANNNASNYTYIIYPASYGDLSNVIQNGALSVLTAFTSLGNYTINTPTHNVSVSMRFYRSNSPGAFAEFTLLTIS